MMLIGYAGAIQLVFTLACLLIFAPLYHSFYLSCIWQVSLALIPPVCFAMSCKQMLCTAGLKCHRVSTHLHKIQCDKP